MNRPLRIIAAVVVLVLAVVAGLAGGLIGFFGGALLTASIVTLQFLGLVGLLAGAFGAGLAAFALFGARRREIASATFAAALALTVAVLTAITVFHPMPHTPVAAAPSYVRYWNLPTGSRIAYDVAPAAGKARPTPVILLHGGPGTPGEGIPGSGRAMAAEGFTVYSYDQIGAGRSARLADVTKYTVARNVADLEAIRATIGAERVILVGESWGATLAASYLAAYPQHVARVVFSSPGTLWEPAFPGDKSGDLMARDTPAQRDAAEKPLTTARMLVELGLQKINPNAAHHLVPDNEADTQLRKLMLAAKDLTACPGAAPTPTHGNRPGYYTNQLTSADTAKVPDPRPKLRTIGVPALIMRAQCDFMKWGVTYDYRRTLPNSTLVYIKGAGHGIEHEQPKLYADLLCAFVLGRPLPLPAYTSSAPPA